MSSTIGVHPDQSTIVSRFLDTVGDGSGLYQATGNYLSAAEDFKIVPASNEVITLERMIVSVSDTVGMDADFYGNNLTLVNGIKVEVRDGSGLIFSLTDPQHPVFTNAGWAHYCYDASMLTWGTGNENLVVRWTFSKSGAPVVLRGIRGEYLTVTVNDNLTGLDEHQFLVQGLSRTP
jgi:hypothetical protein